MKQNISEMLNDLSVEDISINNTSPLSSRNIRGRTMERVGITGKMRRKMVFSKAALIAAVLMSMMVTACTADTVFNEGRLFGVFFDSELTKQQLKTLVNIGKTFDQEDKLTSNGAVLTPISVVTDGQICYLYFRLEAPEGVVLEDLPEDRTYSFMGKDHPRQELEAIFENERYTLKDEKVNALPDEDPTDNVKEFVLELNAYWTSGFNGNTVRLRIPGLWVKGLPDTSSKYHYSKVFSADFEFDITVSKVDERIDLKDVGVSHYVEEYDFSVNLKRIMITPLRMEVYYSATLPENEDILPAGGYAQLVMKDGTKLTFGDLSHVSDGPNVGYQVLSKVAEYYDMDVSTVVRDYKLDDRSVKYVFEEPVVLEEIDYIVWCGGKIIDVN